jgi:hypothetical protein
MPQLKKSPSISTAAAELPLGIARFSRMTICLKATHREPCDDIAVHDCVLGTECGALKLGTESYGDTRWVRVCDF